MSTPYINAFSGVNYPILTANDLAKGMWRGVYEGVRGRPLRTSTGHAVAQIVGSAVGRAIDSQDDRTGIGMLQGSNMIVQSVAVGLVSGGIDTAMGRGSKIERFMVPMVIDGVIDRLAPTIYSGNPRIL